jgi:hypothetical protein
MSPTDATPKKAPAKKAPAKKAAAKKAAPKKATTAKAKAEEAEEPEVAPQPTELDQGAEGEASEELSPQDELDLKRLDIALVTLDDESLRRGLAGINEKQRQELATHLNLPRATVHLGDGLAPLVRRKLRGLSIDRQHAIATALTQRANDTTVELLGDRSEDPSRADLDEVLPAVLDEYGTELVRLMIASYAISDAPVREVMRELLDSDERFALPDVAPDDTAAAKELPSFGLVARPTEKQAAADPERAELRERRKIAKAERRAAEQRERKARTIAQASRREALHAAKRPPAPR